jgi:hypothetical protein
VAHREWRELVSSVDSTRRRIDQMLDIVVSTAGEANKVGIHMCVRVSERIPNPSLCSKTNHTLQSDIIEHALYRTIVGDPAKIGLGPRGLPQLIQPTILEADVAVCVQVVQPYRLCCGEEGVCLCGTR